jgi:UDP-glucose 4-epimerase
MKCLMTGSRGDVGATLFELMRASGDAVEAFRPEAAGSAQRMLHLAAKSPPASPEDLVRSNVGFLQQVIGYCGENRIEELIFFSSASVYGNQDRTRVTEGTPLCAPGLYGASKLLGEELLRESSLRVLCLRLPAILSKHNTSNLMSRIYDRLAADAPVTLSNADQIFNNFVSIEAIRDFIAGVELREGFDVVNLAAAPELTLYEITRLMRDGLDSRSEIVMDEREAPFFNLCTAKAVERYGYQPCAPTESIERWLKQRKRQ